MNPSALLGADPVFAYVKATRDLAADLDGLDPEKIERSIQRQIDSFEALSSSIGGGTLRSFGVVAAAIEEGRLTIREAQGRMREIRSELQDLRTSRARTSRRLESDSAARFLSQRV